MERPVIFLPFTLINQSSVVNIESVSWD